MKKLISTILVAATVAFCQTDSSGKQAGESQAKVLTRAEIDDLLSKPDQVLVIDVRRPIWAFVNRGAFALALSRSYSQAGLARSPTFRHNCGLVPA